MTIPTSPPRRRAPQGTSADDGAAGAASPPRDWVGNVVIALLGALGGAIVGFYVAVGLLAPAVRAYGVSALAIVMIPCAAASAGLALVGARPSAVWRGRQPTAVRIAVKATGTVIVVVATVVTLFSGAVVLYIIYAFMRPGARY